MPRGLPAAGENEVSIIKIAFRASNRAGIPCELARFVNIAGFLNRESRVQGGEVAGENAYCKFAVAWNLL